MTKPLRLLLVEDNEDDALLIVREIERGGYRPAWERVETADGLLAAIDRQPWDVVTCGWGLPQFSAAAALMLLQERKRDVPFIIVSGDVGEEVAASAMKSGAHDFVSKRQLSRLTPAVERELREAEQRRLRKCAEESLRRSEERYRLLVENLNDVIFAADPEGRLTYVSPAILRLSGYIPADLTGQNFSRFVHPDDLPALLVSFVETLAGRLQPSEFRVYDGNGRIRHVRTSSRPQYENGQLIGTIGIITDLTERKQAELALAKHSRMLDAVFDHTLSCLVLLDREFNFVRVNPAYARACRRDISDFIGRNHFDIYPSDARAIFEQVIASKQPSSVTARPFFFPDQPERGVTYWDWTLVPLLDDGGEVEFLLFSLHDVTEHVQTAAALRESEERFAKAFEHAAIGMALVAPDGRFLSVNQSLCELVGYSTEELRSKTFQDLTHPEDLDTDLAFVRQMLAGDIRYYHMQKRYFHKLGHVVWVHLSVSLVRDERGQPLYFVSQIKDIAERKRAEQEVQRLNAELEQRVLQRTAQLEAVNKELEAFSYSVSHDLRAPLRHIEGFTRILIEDYANTLDAEGRRYLERVVAGAQHMGRLIQHLLSLSRLTAQKLTLHSVDLSELANSIATDLAEHEPHRRVEFVITPGLVTSGDSHLLRIALDNLLRNAWKYTSRHPSARIEFGAIEGEGGVVYFLRDDGVGFNMVDAQKLFGAFSRLHRESEFEGMGIGLATVQRIIHRHGGRIWAEAAIDQGATFYFTLPRPADSHRPSESPQVH